MHLRNIIRATYISVLVGVVSLSQAQEADDVLLTVGDMPVTVGEFRYIYEKNNGDAADYSEGSVEEYLDLYTKFKLKVAKAKRLQMDTISALRDELEIYRKQLANSYLMDREVKQKLINSAFDRRQQDVAVAHILIKKARVNGLDADAEAIKKIERIKNEIASGNTEWDAAVKAHSSDQSSAGYGGSMGYLTAPLPAGFVELERSMYDAEVGEMVGPVQTKLGYHLIKVLDKRPARGVVDAAHVLIRKPKDGNMNAAKEKAMKAYTDLQSGMSWEQVVTQYSDDRDSKNKKGSIGKVKIGQYAASFEDALFALDQDGAYTEPVQTSAGFHIILRKSKEDLKDYENFYRLMDNKIERLPRYKEEKEQLITRIKAKHNYKVNEAALTEFVSTVGEDFYTYKWAVGDVEDVEVFRFNDNIYKMADFAAYLKKNVKSRQRYSKTKSTNVAVRELLEKYSNEEAILYEETNLEASYPDFRNLMREYREGILLFEASKVNVWDKASADTMGLKRFYENNRTRYRHPAMADVTTVTAMTTDAKQLRKIKKMIAKKGIPATLAKYNKKNPSFISSAESQVEQGSNNMLVKNWQSGAISEPVVNAAKGTSTITMVSNIVDGRTKSLSEARGYVIADYQDYLEKQWVRELKAEFPIETNKQILKRLIK
jgi:peptidyl-prolyl cis-trans isomerase SurA